MMNFVIATRNRHKVEEIKAVLGEDHEYFTLADFQDAPKVDEDRDTFAGNASKKAIELGAWLCQRAHPPERLPLYVLADDSGLEVDALDGAPGVYSARFAASDGGAAGNSSDAANNAKLLRLLGPAPAERRSARFHCVIAVVQVSAAWSSSGLPGEMRCVTQPDARCFDGVCEGRILFEPRGSAGFGYDPLFLPTGSERSFAELGEEVKNRISHRAHALAKVRAALGA